MILLRHHSLLGEHPLRRLALSAKTLQKLHPSLAGELPHQVHPVPVVPPLPAEALHLPQVGLLLPDQFCRARERGTDGGREDLLPACLGHRARPKAGAPVATSSQ